MTFREAEEYLLGLEQFGMRFGLERMGALMANLGEPQKRFESVHVVGTNGKSSTVRFTAAILERHGVSTGSYTSPHLRSFRERVEVGEVPLSEERFAAAVTRAAEAAREVDAGREHDDRVTQFEALTAAAYAELADAGAQVAVIEAGLGGRLDATNVIGSRVQVLTNVDLEHTRWLGHSVAEIAREKVAVVREGSTLVTGSDLHPEALREAERTRRQRNASLVRVPLPPGGLQRRNFALAEAAAEAFVGHRLNPAAVLAAWDETRVPGRLQILADRPLTILDGAHNPAGARALAAELPDMLAGRSPLVLVLSVLEDKDAAGLLEPLLALADVAVLTRCTNTRALGADTLAELSAQAGGPPGVAVPNPRLALARAREIAGEGGAVLAAGSIYLVADLLREEPTAAASSL